MPSRPSSGLFTLLLQRAFQLVGQDRSRPPIYKLNMLPPPTCLPPPAFLCSSTSSHLPSHALLAPRYARTLRWTAPRCHLRQPLDGRDSRLMGHLMAIVRRPASLATHARHSRRCTPPAAARPRAACFLPHGHCRLVAHAAKRSPAALSLGRREPGYILFHTREHHPTCPPPLPPHHTRRLRGGHGTAQALALQPSRQSSANLDRHSAHMPLLLASRTDNRHALRASPYAPAVPLPAVHGLPTRLHTSRQQNAGDTPYPRGTPPLRRTLLRA